MHEIGKPTINLFLKKLRRNTKNSVCFDCQKPHPTWINHALCMLVCTQCAGLRRACPLFGRMKSSMLDIFSEKDLRRIFVSNNKLAFEWKGKGKEVYCEEYKEKIDKLVIKSEQESPGLGFLEEERKVEAIEEKVEGWEVKKMAVKITKEEQEAMNKEKKIENSKVKNKQSGPKIKIEKLEKKEEIANSLAVKTSGFGLTKSKNKKLVADPAINVDQIGLNCEVEQKKETAKFVFKKHSHGLKSEKGSTLAKDIKKAANVVSEKGKVLYNNLINKFKK